MRQVEVLEPLAQLQGADRAQAGVNDRRVGGVAGVHHVGAAVVVPFLRVERADDVQVMHLLGDLGQVLADLDPGAEVSIGLNGPPFFSLSGFRSQMSRWLGPPPIQSTMQLSVGLSELLGRWPRATRRTGWPGRRAPWRPGGPSSGAGSSERKVAVRRTWHRRSSLDPFTRGRLPRDQARQRGEPQRRSVNQDEFVRIEQGPEQILQDLKADPGKPRDTAACSTSAPWPGMPAQGGQVDRIDHERFGDSAIDLGLLDRHRPGNCPACRRAASCISSPFIIISAWGIVPWKLVDSSPSSLAKAKRNCLSQASRFWLSSSPDPARWAVVAVSSESKSCSGRHRLELHLAEEPLVLFARTWPWSLDAAELIGPAVRMIQRQSFLTS